ncbi:hypothetical protein [Streptomyces fagopyri]
MPFDDSTDHAWTLREILSGAAVGGPRFFDFRAYHQRTRER